MCLLAAGVIELWTNVGRLLKPTSGTQVTKSVTEDANLPLSGLPLLRTSASVETGHRKKICTAGEWYLFPSHFFLPSDYSVGFIEGNFHGLLPRYFPETRYNNHTSEKKLGTSVSTGSDFNDRNREVRERYDLLASCDALVLTSEVDGDNNNTPIIPPFLGNKHSATHPFRVVAYRAPILDAAKSSSSLARAFYIPKFSEKHNLYKAYTIIVPESTGQGH
jgi:hypothetical protein